MTEKTSGTSPKLTARRACCAQAQGARPEPACQGVKTASRRLLGLLSRSATQRGKRARARRAASSRLAGTPPRDFHVSLANVGGAPRGCQSLETRCSATAQRFKARCALGAYEKRTGRGRPHALDVCSRSSFQGMQRVLGNLSGRAVWLEQFAKTPHLFWT